MPLLLALTTAALALPIVDGAVMDPDGPTVFVMHRDGGVRAFDTDTGAPRWTSTLVDKPIAAGRGAVLAHSDRTDAGTLGVYLLDATTGAVVAECGEVALPEWAPGLQSGLGQMLTTGGDLTSDAFTLWWSASTRYAGGAAPSPEVEAASRRHAGGALACTRAAGGVAVSVPAPPPDALRVADRLHTVRRGAEGERSGQYHHAVDATGAVKADRWLADGMAWVGLSGDARHALVVTFDPATGAPTTAVHDLATGNVVPSAATLPYGSRFVLRDRRMVTRGPDGAIVGVDPTTGAIAWSVPVRATAYEGPRPP